MNNSIPEGNNIITEKNDLVNVLLNQCEAANMPQVYEKYIESSGGICSYRKIFSFNSYFTPENIKKDLSDHEGIISLSIYSEALNKFYKTPNNKPSTEISDSQPFAPFNCLINYQGLAKIINVYRKKKFLKYSTGLEDLKKLFEISDKDSPKFIKMLNKILEEKLIFGIIQKDPENNTDLFIITWKIFHPSKRKATFQLLLTITAGIIVIPLLFILINIFS